MADANRSTSKFQTVFIFFIASFFFSLWLHLFSIIFRSQFFLFSIKWFLYIAILYLSVYRYMEYETGRDLCNCQFQQMDQTFHAVTSNIWEWFSVQKMQSLKYFIEHLYRDYVFSFPEMYFRSLRIRIIFERIREESFNINVYFINVKKHIHSSHKTYIPKSKIDLSNHFFFFFFWIMRIRPCFWQLKNMFVAGCLKQTE